MNEKPHLRRRIRSLSVERLELRLTLSVSLAQPVGVLPVDVYLDSATLRR